MLVSVLLLATVATFAFKYFTTPIPHVTAISPATCSGGETMVIHGSGFGTLRTDSYVELSGNRITTSSYAVWQNNEIRFVLPYNVDDGLLFVVTPFGRSEPVVFTNKDGLPVTVRSDPTISLPVATDLSVEKAEIGSTITIGGSNFGILRGDGRVVFSSGNSDDASDDIECSEFDHDYISWTDYSITVRVPDGAKSGYVFVQTEKGSSNRLPLEITAATGTKTYSDKHTYLVTLGANMTNSSGDGSIFAFVPYPVQSSWQRNKEQVTSIPKPIINNYSNTVLHQIQTKDCTGESKASLKDTFAVDVYEVNLSMTNKTPRTNTAAKDWYPQYTKADAIVPSDAEAVTELSKAIVKKEKSPYQQAILMYNWLLNNITLLQELRPAYYDVLDVLDVGNGDAYDFAILYTALLRSQGIPAIPVSGVLVDQQLKTQNHWWCEFYLDTVGWVPVDPAMGAGLEFTVFKPVENPRGYYFGSLDSQHITISRGWTTLKSSQAAGKKVYRPKTYGLQSMWEEASHDTIQYSSYWNPVVIEGVY